MERFCIIFIPILILLASAEKVIKFYKADFITDQKYITNQSASLLVPERNRVLANYEGDVVQNLKNLSVHFMLYKFYNQFRPFLINELVNVCQASRLMGNYFVKTAVRVLTKYGNGVQCFYKVNKNV